MSEDEYHRLEKLSPDRKYEYIGGVAHLIAGGSVGHDRIRRNTERAVDGRLSGTPYATFGPDIQVKIGAKKNGRADFLYPDTTVSCDSRDGDLDNTLIEHARLVFEVLSPGTETKDRWIKFRAYQDWPTIQEIVLINQFTQYIEVWQRNQDEPDNPKAWLYRHYGPGDTVELTSIHTEIPIAEFYRGMVFDDALLEKEPE